MNRIALLLLGALYSTSLLATELSGTPEELRAFLKSDQTLVVLTGKSEIIAYSDKATVTLVVTSKSKTLSEALKSNTASRTKLTQEITKAGISAEHIKSTEFSSSPHYGLFSRKPSNYEVLNRLTITVSNEAQLQSVSAISDSQDDTTIGSVEFMHSEKRGAEIQAKEEAIDDALDAAKAYSAKLGIKLKPMSFNFNNVHSRQSNSSMVIEEIVVTASMNASSSNRYSRPNPASFDEVKYEASVNVTFEVAQ